MSRAMSCVVFSLVLAVALLAGGVIVVVVGPGSLPASGEASPQSLRAETEALRPAGLTYAQCAAITAASGVGGGAALGAITGVKATVPLEWTGSKVAGVGGFGIVVAAAVVAAVGYYGCAGGGTPPNGPSASANFTTAQLAILGQALGDLETSASAEVSTLNATAAPALEYEASYAALGQISNKTFNVQQDLAASNVASQLAEIQGAYSWSLGAAVQDTYAHWSAAMTNAYPSAVTPLYAELSGGVEASLDTSDGDQFLSGTDLTNGNGVAGSSGIPVWLPEGSTLAGSEPGTCPLQIGLQGAEGNPGFYQNQSLPCPAQLYNVSSTASTGAYNATGMDLSDGGIYIGQQAPAASAAEVTTLIGIPSGDGDASDSGEPVIAISMGPGLPTYSLLPGGALANLGTYLWDLERKAYTAGEAYVGLMHQLGYWNVSSIPAQCLISDPSAFLPPNLNLGNLTAQQLEFMEYQYLDYLGENYNVSLDNATFCGKHVSPPPGPMPYLTSSLNATGQVYAPPGSVSSPGTFLQPSTWPYNGSLLIAPTLGNITIPVGHIWVPPANDPLTVLVYKPGVPLENYSGAFLPHVAGNSTSSNGTIYPGGSGGGASPGYALHLTRCEEYNVTTPVCSIHINPIVIGNQSPPKCVDPSACNYSGGGGGPNLFGGGCINPLNWLGCLESVGSGLASLLGGGIFGAILSLIVTVCILLAVLLLVVWVVVSIFRYLAGKISGKGGNATFTQTLQGRTGGASKRKPS